LFNHNDDAPLGPSSVLGIAGRESGPNIGPGRFYPCPTRFCAVSGCDGTTDLVLSHEEYPDGDPAHMLDWPYMYRRWICGLDKTHVVNVSAAEWQAVQRFARERTREERAERGELGRLGTIVCLVLLVPVFVLHALFLPIGWVIDRFRSPRSRLRGTRRERAETIGEPPARNCAVPGCGGRMTFHPRQLEAAGPHTLEWPWHATWVCETSPAHIEFATPAEERAWRLSERREP